MIFFEDANSNYTLNKQTNIWSRLGYAGIAYNDGDEVEQRIAAIVEQASDITVLSTELRQHCTDWPSLYHLSGTRANILRPFEDELRGDILEIGAGCGAITRYLGECGGNILALEGSKRRAAIARNRTRDLSNVTVVAEKLDDFAIEHQFDVITLIGVLEYANLFTTGDHPAQAMLEHLKKRLKPTGKLIIAIENQLGLKYFAGAPEDHIGQPMYGIEGRYRKDQPETFGRKVLDGMLESVGFRSREFLAPFPDYKLPTSIITESGLKSSGFDAAALISHSVRRDPQLPPILAFSPELAWPSLVKNGLAMDMANSFLIVAHCGNPKLQKNMLPLAWHYSTDRKKQYCKETIFVPHEDEKIEVYYKSLDASNIATADDELLCFSVPDNAPYFKGELLSQEFIQIIIRDQWSLEEVVVFFKKYLSVLAKLSDKDHVGFSIDTEMSGEFFDRIPQNIIIKPDGNAYIIDNEWTLNEKVQIGFLVFRAILTLFFSLSRIGHPIKESGNTYGDFVLNVWRELGWEGTHERLNNYAKFEINIQMLVSGRKNIKNYVLDFLQSPIGSFFNLNSAVIERDSQINNLIKTVTEHDSQIVRLNEAMVERDDQITSLNENITKIISSRSWRLTKPLRFFARLLRGEISIYLDNGTTLLLKEIISINKFRNGFKYIKQGDINGFLLRLRSLYLEYSKNNIIEKIHNSSKCNWAIVTTPHTLFIAHCIAERLRSHGWNVDILTETPKYFSYDWYFVLCAQMFKRLPPGEMRILFQLEQSVSSRWFTNNYLKDLNNSLAVTDYSLMNIEYLFDKKISYPHIHYLPIGASHTYGNHISENKSFDILFYGDSNSSPRRKKMLDILQENFDVKIVNEVFGQEMISLIKRAKIVINIHYYENALLETPRIQECLSLGVPVVSESSSDMDDYPELVEAVTFFEEGSVVSMLNAVNHALHADSSLVIEQSVEKSILRFNFMLDRFLAAMNFLPTSHIHKMIPALPSESNVVCLSLPETIQRRNMYKVIKPTSCEIFDGIRKTPGWVGCGLSYVALAHHGIRNHLPTLTVMEDDVTLPDNFETALKTIKEYLAKRSDTWDVFAGMIASLNSETKVISIEEYNNFRFVTIDRMTSMVMNIYSLKFMNQLVEWNPENTDAETNTIDRFIESIPNLRVVVTLPFLFGHREDVSSTLWGFNNARYREMIQESEQLLQQKVNEYLSNAQKVMLSATVS